MSKHTKGPWRVITPKKRGKIFGEEDTSAFGLTIVTNDNDNDGTPWIIADVAYGQPGECGPDAKLISATPDLLEALEMLRDFQNGCPLPKYEKEWNRAMELANAAIKKAKGEA